MKKKYDVIICVGVKDLFIVQTTVERISSFFDAYKIYLITKRNYFVFFKRLLKKCNNVFLIDEDELIEGLSKDNLMKYLSLHKPFLLSKSGWYFQQFLKIAFAISSYSREYYLIWDADTIPVRHISFFEQERVLFCLKDEYHEPYFFTLMRLIGFKKEISSSFIAEHMMVKVEYMKDLVATIESNEELLGYHYWEKIVSAIDSNVLLGFSEFETYGTFISQKYPESFLFRTLQTYRRAGEIYGRYISKKELNNINGLDTISLEPADSPRLLRRICQFPLRVAIKLISVFY